jgi:alanine racemase
MRICAKIDVQALSENLQVVSRLAPRSRILAMVKANAYGHGLVECAAALEADYLGVATLDEALTLRAYGLNKRIVLMGGVASLSDLEQVVLHQLDCVVYHRLHLDLLKAHQALGSFRVWLKIDTGMHRLGCPSTEAAAFLQSLESMPHVQIEAVMTHLAVADELNHPHTLQQLHQFMQLTQDWPYAKSVVNSAGILHYPEFHLDIVRPGLMLYGLSPCTDLTESEIGIEPVMSLEAQVLNVLEIPAGNALGYGLDWRAERPSRIAVLSAGYGDGYPQYPKPEARVSIHGCLCPIVGRVSMDFLMVDISDCEQSIAVNDLAILWGPQHRVLSPYASLTRVMARVPRVVVSDDCN